MRRSAAVVLLFMLLANALMVSGDGGADEARSGAHGRDASRAVTLIYNVYDLQNMSLDLNGSYELACDIDASGTKSWNGGAGFAPVGVNSSCPFKGTLDGKGYKITGLYINRPGTYDVGLFGCIGDNSKCLVKNTGGINFNVTGRYSVGGLVGYLYYGTVNNSYVMGNVYGVDETGGLVGSSYRGTVDNSCATGNVSGTHEDVGGLVGYLYYGTVNNSYASGNVRGVDCTGGLVGSSSNGMINNSYATGNVCGTNDVGGLLGKGYKSNIKNSYFTGTVNGTGNVGGLIGDEGIDKMSNSHYNIDDVSINEGHYITAGGLFDAQYHDWISNGLTLDISDYSNVLVPSGGCYNINNIQGLRDLLGFSDVAGYKFRLVSDIDLSNDSGLYIPCLAAVFDGDNHTISNQNLNLSFVPFLGMFGFNSAGKIVNTGIVKNRIWGCENVGGLVGRNQGTVHNSYATGIVNGTDFVGGLVGYGTGTVNNSHATGNVNGRSNVGGLVGYGTGKVNNSYATGNVNGKYDVGGLVGDMYDDTVTNSYATGKVTGYGYVGGLVGRCSGPNYRDMVIRSYATGNVTGDHDVGGLVGNNRFYSMVDSYATGNVTGTSEVGGIVGLNEGKISNCHYNIDKISINGIHIITTGGLFDAQYRDWFSNDLSLNISDYSTGLEPSGNFINIRGVQGLRDLLGFSDVAGYRFRLVSDIDLSNDPGLYIPYLAADFDGNDHTTSNMRVNISFNSNIGMFGLNYGGIISNTGLVGNDMKGNSNIGGLVGHNDGTVSNSYAMGNANGNHRVGGLVGYNDRIASGTVINSYATGNVAGIGSVGGLAGYNNGEVINSYASGKVNGTFWAGGLVGYNSGTVSNCFWDYWTSGISSSSGGTGKTTAQMKTRSTFTNAGWDFISVWCMIENTTYPLLRWQDKEFPMADAGPDQTVGEGTMVKLNGSGSSDDIGIADYTWIFTDGIGVTLHGAQPTYRFDNPGIFVVTLNVTDPVGRTNTDTMTITVNDLTAPVADAGPDRVIDEGTSMTFNGSGSRDNVGIVNFTWIFMDGPLVTFYGVQPTYRFRNPGVFIVTLNVTDAAGHFGTDTLTVTVNDITAPVADADSDQIIDEGILVKFNANGSSDNVGIVNYTWTFTDGTPITLFGVQPTYKFDHPGLFEITLNVTDAAGNWGTDAMIVSVNKVKRPVAAYAGPDEVIDEGTLLTFNGTGSNDHAGIVNYTWTFTDGSPIIIYGAQPTYKFDNPGIFVVTLNVTDAAGNRGADNMTVTVNDITEPVADAGQDLTIDEGTPVTFNGSGSSDNVGIVKYTWTFDYKVQRIILYGVSLPFTFDVPGVFSVTLIVSDAAGLLNEDAMTLTVRDITPPVANAGPDRKIPAGRIIAFNALLSTDNVAISRFYWNFTYNGKSQSLEGETVSFRFDKAGIYHIVLTVVDGAGNRGEDRVVITVEPTVNVLQGLLWMPALLIAVAGIAGYAVLRRRKARKGGRSPSMVEPVK